MGYCSSFGRVRDSLSLKPSRSPETSELVYRFAHAGGRFVQLKHALTLLMFCARSSAQAEETQGFLIGAILSYHQPAAPQDFSS